MENPNLSKNAPSPSITYILKKISDDKALVLFNSIAVSSSNEDRFIPLKEMNLSTKQYYSRISGLTDAGLIKRHKGRYSHTMLGKVVYQSQMIIGKALFYYWKLKALESIEIASDNTLPEGELPQLINALIDNHQIKDIIMKSISSSSIESNLKTQAPTAVVEQIQSI
jgi:DNA-binding Lrp family transcriptional regulator